MNTNFSVQRIQLLLRKDWIEYKKKLAFAALTIIGALLLVMALSATGSKVFHPFPFYCLGLLGTWIGFCRYVGQTIHQSKGLYLTLPASSLEKYITLGIEGVIIVLVYIGLFWAGIGIGSLFMEIKAISFQDTIVHLQPFSLLAFMSSLLLLSYITFRKFALGIAVGGYLLMIASAVGLIYLFFKFSGITGNVNGFCMDSSPVYNTLYWLGIGFTPMFLIATLVVLYVSYLKLKEKELR